MSLHASPHLGHRAVLAAGLLALLLATPACGTEAPPPLAPGAGVFTFEHDRGERAESLPIDVHYFKPDGADADTPVWFVMHGMKRNADAYRDNWVEVARDAGVYIVAPRFTDEAFPLSRGYNLGNMFDDFGEPIPRPQWSLLVVDAVFNRLRERESLNATDYAVFGHSAGAQFVHRLVMFVPEAKIGVAVSANAGWYTLPDASVDFPYGLGGTALEPGDLPAVFDRPLVLLLGDQDTDPEHRYLRKTAEALVQGPHRFARGRYFLDTAQHRAQALGVPLRWSVTVAPGVGHSNRDIAPFAAELMRRTAPSQAADSSAD